MTENQYITVKNLGHIISAKECLRHVVPETSDYITEKDYRTLMLILSAWEDRHLAAIKINETLS